LPHPPIICGGFGLGRTPKITARFATEMNIPYMPPADVAARFAKADEACEAIGRDPATLRRSAAVLVCCADNEQDMKRRRDWLEEKDNQGPEQDRSKYPRTLDVEHFAAVGTPEQVIERIGAYQEIGCERIFLHLYDFSDLDQVALIAEQVMPAFNN
jgi:alkanesulfonate monooxygenase SsuD/methylene tetrahydromethanopterin reductase-like flavin-dependent oxidoreductase (luciferase family)